MPADPVARGLAAKANTAAGISAAGGALSNGIYNATPATLTSIRRARVAVSTGAANGVFLFVGMSTFFGQGAGTGGTGLTGCVAKSLPAQLATVLSARGVPAIAEGYFGDGNQFTAAALTDANPKFSFAGSSWTSWSAGVRTAGGWALRNVTGTDVMSYTPGINVTNFRTYYIQASGTAEFTTQIDSETAATINSSGSAAVVGTYSTAVSSTAASHTLKIARTGTGGQLYIVGVRAWDSNRKTIECINLGWSGSKVSDWNVTTNAYSPSSAVTAIITDINTISANTIPVTVFLGIDINDWIAGTDPATYKTGMAALITAFQATGAGVVLVAGPPSASGSAPLATQAAIIAKQYELAREYNCALVDMTALFVSWTAANAAGFENDGVHQKTSGYNDQAWQLSRLVFDLQ